jgi:hypothetical protein
MGHILVSNIVSDLANLAIWPPGKPLLSVSHVCLFRGVQFFFKGTFFPSGSVPKGHKGLPAMLFLNLQQQVASRLAPTKITKHSYTDFKYPVGAGLPAKIFFCTLNDRSRAGPLPQVSLGIGAFF